MMSLIHEQTSVIFSALAGSSLWAPPHCSAPPVQIFVHRKLQCFARRRDLKKKKRFNYTNTRVPIHTHTHTQGSIFPDFLPLVGCQVWDQEAEAPPSRPAPSRLIMFPFYQPGLAFYLLGTPAQYTPTLTVAAALTANNLPLRAASAKHAVRSSGAEAG